MDNFTIHVTNALDSVQINCGSSSSTSPTVMSGHKYKWDELRSEMCTLNSIINQLRSKVNFLVSFLGLDDDQSNSSNIPNNQSQVHSISVTESSTTSNAAISGPQNSTNSYVDAVRSKSTHFSSHADAPSSSICSLR